LRPKFVFRKILMMMKMKFSSNKHLNISSSIHLREIFFWRMLYRAFSIVIFSSLDTHTSRLRKVSRNRRKRACETSDLKFFSVYSSKSSWNCFHNSLSMRLSVFHSLIFVSTHFSQFWISFIPLFNSDCGRNALTAKQICKNNGLPNRRIIVCEMLWLRSNFARVQRLARSRVLWLRSSFARVWWLAEVVCEVNLPWLRGGTNLVGWDSKEEIAESNRTRTADGKKNNRFDWNRGSREQIVNQACFLSSW
jgi:hypothetical protein